MRVRSVFAIAASSLAALVLTLGCASRDGCFECSRTDTTPGPDQPTCDSAQLERALRARAQPPRVLLLSGGGAKGAWGAGFLKGWSEEGSRPEAFDVVTGISTGALQATFAFLGGPANDDKLVAAYTSVSNRDIFRKRFPLWEPLGALFSSSMRKTWPLGKKIEQEIPDAAIDRVAAQAGTRLLCIGTVNLDSGEFVAWDMTQLAALGRYDRYRRVIRASASVPVVFEPIEIDDALHVDGGVREQVFARVMMGRIRSLRIGAPGGRRFAPSAPPVAYALVNGKLAENRECTPEASLEIAGRSLGLMMNEAMIGNLHKSQAELPADWSFKVARIPDDYTLFGDSLSFDPVEMAALLANGLERGRLADWYDGVPPVPPPPFGCD